MSALGQNRTNVTLCIGLLSTHQARHADIPKSFLSSGLARFRAEHASPVQCLHGLGGEFARLLREWAFR
jgi:hypothetical protein